MHDSELEQFELFLDELATGLARYQTARTKLILMQHADSQPKTLRAWTGAIDKIRAEQESLRDLILSYAHAPAVAEDTRITDYNRGQAEFEDSALSLAPEV